MLRLKVGTQAVAVAGDRVNQALVTAGFLKQRCEATDELLSLIDVLVEGRFVLAQKDISLKFRGSRNQRILDMNRTREAGEVVLWDEGRRGL